MSKLVFGVGINDSDYKVSLKEELPKVGGKRKQRLVWLCVYYDTWKAMLRRCFSKESLIKHPSYNETSVCEEWLIFSNFRNWMLVNYEIGFELDKDLIGDGTLYSPETCCFLPPKINSFLVKSKNNKFSLGTHYSSRYKKYVSQCSDPFTGKKVSLGLFENQIDAHTAWLKQKHNFSIELSKLLQDVKLKKLLIERFKL